MLIDALATAMRKSGALDAIEKKFAQGGDAALGLASSARPLLTAVWHVLHPSTMLVIVPGDDTAEAFTRTLRAYLGDEQVLSYPLRADVPFAPRKPNMADVALRTQAAWALQSDSRRVVVASAAAMTRALPPVEAQACAPLKVLAGTQVIDVATGEMLDYEGVQNALVAKGFENTGSLDGPGTFAVKGGLIDVYPGTTPYPVRLDFFGDDVDEIRRIVPSTGQSIASLDRFDIYPVREYTLNARTIRKAKKAIEARAETDAVWRDLYDKLQTGQDFLGADALLPEFYGTTASLGSYMPKDAIVVQCEPRSLFDDAARAFDEASQRAQGSHIPVDGLYIPASKLDFGHARRLTFAAIMQIGGKLDDNLPVKRTGVAGDTEKLLARLHELVAQGYTTVFSVPDVRARRDMKTMLVENGLGIVEALDGEQTVPDEFKRGVMNVVDVDVPLGMIIPKAKLGIVSIHDTQGRSSHISQRRRVDITEVTFPFKPGDYVVHAAHGIAYFKDIVRQDVGGTVRDYLLLEYAEGDKLFVPVEQLDRVTRYVGPEGSNPRLTRLNTSDWSRAMTKARKATRKLAFDLVDVYTRRASVQGFRYSPDTPWQKEMEDAFPYEETPDQLTAVAEVKADMQSSKPMDRLICGDVGFGKTEVALRAAFKAVQDHKQVMVLCPTTILAQQHYTTFSERFEPFGVTVEVLSRFKTDAEQKKALEGFADGSVDVLVGTHRLLSRDVNPHDLGLVVIDEEQRFGVQHKEQLKNLREQIDVLTLSATPIPRTMQMSLSGVRDMSLILTPPDNRRPVEVHVGEWDVDVVSDAIRRELQRGGQVYYVSNRVRTIEDAVQRVRDAAGEARIGVAHGKMSKEELERVMEDFSAGQIDVLVATTIIESGIDNPHTNTLIIEDSQRLGLAQMYQLKGRVGRSATQAYAYFMFPENVSLTEEATARLEAINEHRDLGSGMRIAMRDLEIRGAGSLLGAEQSGNMSAVGFDLFAQMLQNAVGAARDGSPQTDDLPAALSDITVNVPAKAYFDEEYVGDADARVLLYRKIACAETVAVVDDIEADAQQRWGDMPQEAKNMFTKAHIRAWANERGIKNVSVAGGRLTIEPVPMEREALIPLKRYGARYVNATHRLMVPMRYFKVDKEKDEVLDVIWRFLQKL